MNMIKIALVVMGVHTSSLVVATCIFVVFNTTIFILVHNKADN